MTEHPELSDGHGRIANEIMEVLACTYMSSYESQFIWCLFRNTYGWNKKDDWISLSKIAEATGMQDTHVSRTKKKLLLRRIITQTGKKIAFNKYHSQWTRLPKQVTTKTPAQIGHLPPPEQVILPPPIQADTIYNDKDILQKTEPKEKIIEIDENDWKRTVLENEWCDESYADKTWSQYLALSQSDREEFRRKSGVMLICAKHHRTQGKGKVIFHEIAALVNDRGAMQRKLTPQEIEDRKEFSENLSDSNFSND